MNKPASTTGKRGDIAEAVLFSLVSPNESDRNLEAANVVDGLFAIARGLHDVADAIRKSEKREGKL